MRRADTRGIRSCLVPAFPCAWLSFSLGSSWLRESPLPSPGVPKCPTGSSKMALPWVGRCGILRISLSLPPSVPFLSLCPPLSICLSVHLSHVPTLSPPPPPGPHYVFPESSERWPLWVSSSIKKKKNTKNYFWWMCWYEDRCNPSWTHYEHGEGISRGP